MNNRMHCLILDLKDNEELIQEYENYHQEIWPEIKASILDSGINTMEIFRAGNRLVMLMQVDEGFSFDRKQKADESNSIVQDWEKLMWKFQQRIPFAKEDEKWVLAKKIFELSR